MSNQEDKLKLKYGQKGGWRVPEGYFESVYKEIGEKLPDYPEVQRHVEMTRWQRIKPYIYLAAMFAGIWLMMKVFYHASGNVTLSLENPPEHIALAMSEPDLNDFYSLPESISDIELEREVSGEYNSIEEFEKDFGYEFEPEYKDIDLSDE